MLPFKKLVEKFHTMVGEELKSVTATVVPILQTKHSASIALSDRPLNWDMEICRKERDTKKNLICFLVTSDTGEPLLSSPKLEHLCKQNLIFSS